MPPASQPDRRGRSAKPAADGRIRTEQLLLDPGTRRRFFARIRSFFGSDVGSRAQLLFAGLLLLLLTINGFNVINSYVARDFMTAIENRDADGFAWQAFLWAAVFAASTVVAVFYRFCEERLALLWRSWLTRRVLAGYLEHQTYYRVNLNDALQNPDQRIAEDIRTFATSTLSLLLMCLNATLTVFAFSGVMWAINPRLFVVGVLYALAGSTLTMIFGRPLVGLNYVQADKEANFRSDLIHLRHHAESVALLHREGHLRARLLQHLDDLVGNARHIIAVNRNLGFFTTGYNYMVQVIPVVIVAPFFIRGEVEFGVVTQSAMAFSHLLGAFSLIVTQFQSISSYAAVLSRVEGLAEAIEPKTDPTTGIEVVETEGCLRYEHLTLHSPRDNRVLVHDLSVEIPCGTRVLLVAADASAKIALFRATAGIWDNGEGRIVRPLASEAMFIPERPYLSPGTLRGVLLRSGHESEISEAKILQVLRQFEVETVVARSGGLDVERNWDESLSLDEQQLLLLGRAVLLGVRFVFLDRIDAALNARQVERALIVLREHGVTYLSVGDYHDRLEPYDAMLDIGRGGVCSWRLIHADEQPMMARATEISQR